MRGRLKKQEDRKKTEWGCVGIRESEGRIKFKRDEHQHEQRW